MAFSDEEAEELAGRCCALTKGGKRCPNAALAGSRYCGIPAHQKLAEEAADAEDAGGAAGGTAADEPLDAAADTAVAGEGEAFADGQEDDGQEVAAGANAPAGKTGPGGTPTAGPGS